MLNKDVQRKLDRITELPTIPVIISQVLEALENTSLSAAQLGRIIEKDQTLTARVLRISNSPFYGFSRRISTIDLAIVVLGIDSIKEIVLSLIIQRLFSKVRKDIFDINQFWNYSVYCASASRLLARKLGYKLAGEAFVAGLMHDIGLLILIEYFTDDFLKIRSLQAEQNVGFVEAERIVLQDTHCEIGAWLAEKWNLPEQIVNSIKYHHNTYAELKRIYGNNFTDIQNNNSYQKSITDITPQPLTALVAMAEWFAKENGYKDWAMEVEASPLYLANEVLSALSEDDVLDPNSAIELLKHEVSEEFNNASIFNEITKKA